MAVDQSDHGRIDAREVQGTTGRAGPRHLGLVGAGLGPTPPTVGVTEPPVEGLRGARSHRQDCRILHAREQLAQPYRSQIAVGCGPLLHGDGVAGLCPEHAQPNRAGRGSERPAERRDTWDLEARSDKHPPAAEGESQRVRFRLKGVSHAVNLPTTTCVRRSSISGVDQLPGVGPLPSPLIGPFPGTWFTCATTAGHVGSLTWPEATSRSGQRYWPLPATWIQVRPLLRSMTLPASSVNQTGAWLS